MIREFLKLDWILIVAVLLLVGLGLAVLFPISYLGEEVNIQKDHFFRQLIFAGIGLVVFFALSLSDYRFWDGASPYLYVLGILSLFLVLFFGKAVRGTAGWLSIGELNIQPVEPFKLIMVAYLARYFSRQSKKTWRFRHILISFVPVLIAVAFILWQPDLGSASVILGVWFGMLVISGVKKKHLFFLITIIAIVALVGWSFFLKDYQKERVLVLVNPSSDPLGAGYNVIQSTVAVGSGGMWGKGLGHGSQTQLNFLPEKHTDFIFAVIAEELGLGGALFVIILFLVVIMRLFSISSQSRDDFGRLMVGGFIMIIFFQSVINIGMNIGVFPITGIPLPLLSYGGSSLVTILIALGVSESVHRAGQNGV